MKSLIDVLHDLGISTQAVSGCPSCPSLPIMSILTRWVDKQKPLKFWQTPRIDWLRAATHQDVVQKLIDSIEVQRCWKRSLITANQLYMNLIINKSIWQLQNASNYTSLHQSNIWQKDLKTQKQQTESQHRCCSSQFTPAGGDLNRLIPSPHTKMKWMQPKKCSQQWSDISFLSFTWGEWAVHHYATSQRRLKCDIS